MKRAICLKCNVPIYSGGSNGLCGICNHPRNIHGKPLFHTREEDTPVNVPEQKGDYLADGWKIENKHSSVALYDPNGVCVIFDKIGVPWNCGDADYYRRSDVCLRQFSRLYKDKPEHQPIEDSPVELRNEIRKLRAEIEKLKGAK